VQNAPRYVASAQTNNDLCSLYPGLLSKRSKQAVIALALRQQLATFAEKGRRPRITPSDRGFWVLLSRVWSGWKEILVIVQPETVVRWHRKGFRLYWRSISKRAPGRPPIPAEVRVLIRRFANENRWRARKVRAGLAKLGISVSLATVSRYLPKRNSDYDQRNGGGRSFTITSMVLPGWTSSSSPPFGSDYCMPGS
jgi:hypothetical protein